MSRTRSEKPERERPLLNKTTLETCPRELRQSLAYLLHLRSHWKREACTKLIVPSSWMEFLALADDTCGMGCVAKRRCPFGDVRFEGLAETRLCVPDDELSPAIVSQLLTDFGSDSCLATLIPRAFEGLPCTRLRRTASDIPATRLARSQSPLPRIDFALVLGHDISVGNKARCLLLGMQEMQHSEPCDSCSEPVTLASIPETLTSHGHFHLTLLASLIKGGAVETTTESFPEWLVLFGLVYDAHHVRIIAYLPQRRKSDVIDCVAYIVDQLSLHSSSAAEVPACALVFERLRLLLAFTTLRRHVLGLFKSLFSAIDLYDGIGRTEGRPSFTCDQHHPDDSESLERCSSLCSNSYRSSEYSTCPSSLRAHESNGPVLECWEELSSSCTFCSTCSSLESASTTDSSYAKNSKYTDSDNYMEPSTTCVSHDIDEGVACRNTLTKTKRGEIIAWARKVIPTEHPVTDTYKMVIRHPHPRRQRVADRRH